MKIVSKKIYSIVLALCFLFSALFNSAFASSTLTLKENSNLSIVEYEGIKTVSGVSDKTSVNVLLSHFNSQDEITVKAGGSIISGSAIVGTGTSLSLNSDIAYVIVLGDTTGDGNITSTDYLQVRRHILGNFTLEGVYFAAADTNGNASIDSTDYLQIRRHLLGEYSLYAEKTEELPADSSKDPSADSSDESSEGSSQVTYVINKNSKKIHLSTCSGAASISDANKQTYTGDISDLTAQGYTTCGICLAAGTPNGSESASPSVSEIPPYSGSAYCVINDNVPTFSASELTTKGYEKYSELDSLGRCGVAIASCGTDTMPTGDRGSISSIKPSGWVQATYDCVSGGSLYNRSHLIAWSLCGEDANEKNLVTGTTYMNQGTMDQFESMVRDYINETGNHVAYRVTPIFEGNNLVCNGVQMEAYSVEDNGEGICFNVFCYNVQPGVVIDYATGNSHLENSQDSSNDSNTTITSKYVINKSSKKVHLSTCSSVSKIAVANIQQYDGNLDELLSQGYTACTTCIGKESSDSTVSSEEPSSEESSTEVTGATYIINSKTKKVHLSTCSGAASISAANKVEYNGSLDELLNQGYTACKTCLADSSLDNSSSEEPSSEESSTEVTGATYIINSKTKKVHLSTCSGAASISAANKVEYNGSLDELLNQGYTACKTCLADSSSNDSSSDNSSSEEPSTEVIGTTYILNTKTKKIHASDCGSVKTISEANKGEYTGSIDDLIAQGYTACGSCKPS